MTPLPPGPRIYGPKPADSPSIGRGCCVCGKAFRAGDYTTLSGETPASIDDHDKARAGLAHNVRAVEIHAKCAGVQ